MYTEDLAGPGLKATESELGYILQQDERGRFWRVGYSGGGLYLTLEKDPTQEVFFNAFPFRALMELFEDAMEDPTAREDRRAAIGRDTGTMSGVTRGQEAQDG